jgi:hypothetical protein
VFQFLTVNLNDHAAHVSVTQKRNYNKIILPIESDPLWLINEDLKKQKIINKK